MVIHIVQLGIQAVDSEIWMCIFSSELLNCYLVIQTSFPGFSLWVFFFFFNETTTYKPMQNPNSIKSLILAFRKLQ